LPAPDGGSTLAIVTETVTTWSDCPGCGLTLPEGRWPAGRVQASPACWQLYTEVSGYAMGEPSRYGQVHQLSVDAYGAQHAGQPSPLITTAFALIGLHLALDRDASASAVRDAHQHLANLGLTWPQFQRPARTGALTVFDVAMAGGSDSHAPQVRAWAESVWAAWAGCHDEVAAFTARHLPG
jgi:hypothetical protein